MLKKLVKIATKLKADHKVTDDEYYLLRASPVVHEMLGEKTLGDPDAFSASTVDEVLSEIQQKARSKEFERYKVERDEHQQTQLKLTASKLEKAQLAGRSVEISETVARLVAAGLFALLLAAGAAIVVAPFFTSLVERPIVKVLCVIGGVIMGLAGFGYELNFRDMRDRMRTSVKTAVLAWLTETHSKRDSAD